MTYPVYDKGTWGPKYWFTLENTLATMPKDATPEQKNDYANFAKLMVKLLPCGDCSEHSQEIIKNAPLSTTDPKTAFISACNLHNKVNEKNNKKTEDCNSLWDNDSASSGCDSCNIKDATSEEKTNAGESETKVPENSGSNDTQAGSDNSDTGAATDTFDAMGQPQANPMDKRIQQYNSLATKIFKDLCKQHGLPVPKNLNQQPCPIDNSTSCNLYEGDKAQVYLHPIVTSLRTIYHEFDHYKDIVTGNSSQIDEGKANNFVASALGAMVAPGPGQTTNVSPSMKAAKEEDTDEKFVTAEVKEDISNKTIGQVDKELSQNVKASYYDISGQDTSFINNFPMLKSTLAQIESEKELVKEKKVSKDGILKHIDHFYETPAKYTGIEKEEMNLLYTPVLFHNIVTNIIDTNMTPLGSALANTVIGAILIGAAVFQKKNLRHRDNLVVQLLGSLFMFNSLSYVNMKTIPEIKRGAQQVMSRIKQGKYNFSDLLIETPKMKQRRDRYNQMVSSIMVNPHSARAIAGIPGVPINTQGVTPIPIQSAVSAYGAPITYNNMTPGENVLAGTYPGGSNLPNTPYGPGVGPQMYYNPQNTRGIDVYPNQIGLSDDEQMYNQQYNEDASNPFMQYG